MRSRNIDFFFPQESVVPFCTSDGLACVAKVAKEAFDCKTPCTGVYTEVFRTDDTKQTTDLMRLANLVFGLGNQGNLRLNSTLLDKIPRHKLQKTSFCGSLQFILEFPCTLHGGTRTWKNHKIP